MADSTMFHGSVWLPSLPPFLPLHYNGVGSVDLHYEAVKVEAKLMGLDYDSTRKGDEAKKNRSDTRLRITILATWASMAVKPLVGSKMFQ